MNRRPEDPSIVVYAPVTRLFIGRFAVGPGLAYVEQDIFRYTDNRGRKIVNVNVKDLQSMSVQNAYVDSGGYSMPCSCCSCAGCPDGVLDIRGTITQEGDQIVWYRAPFAKVDPWHEPSQPVQAMTGQEFHIGLAMPDPEDFMEKLNSEISRRKMEF